MNMIVSMIFHNPIIDSNDELIVNYPNIDIKYWIDEQEHIERYGLYKELNNILSCLDCTKLYNDKQINTTTNYRYSYYLSKYYHLLLKINNQFYYNYYFNRLINVHIRNILFEYEHPNKPITIKNIKHKKAKDKFVKYTTRNIITGNIVYKYINNKTGEEYESSNPNLEEELNKPKRKAKEKVKRDKVVKVKHMIFKI